MATNNEVIGDALLEIQVRAEGQPLSPEQGLFGLRKLNDMIEAWTEDGIELGYFAQSDATAECPLPLWAVRAAKVLLTVELAPAYGATISPELAVKIDDAKAMLLRKAVVENAQASDMSHLPRGEAWGDWTDITQL